MEFPIVGFVVIDESRENDRGSDIRFMQLSDGFHLGEAEGLRYLVARDVHSVKQALKVLSLGQVKSGLIVSLADDVDAPEVLMCIGSESEQMERLMGTNIYALAAMDRLQDLLLQQTESAAA